MSLSNDLDNWPAVHRDFLDTPNGVFHVRTAGAHVGNRPPLVLVHPFPSSSRYYAGIMPLLAEKRLVVAVDTPGFGDSFRPSAPPTIAEYAVWLSQAAEALGFGVYDVLGHSSGAGVAAEMAVHCPDRVRRLVLVEPPLLDVDDRAERLEDSMPPRPRPDGSHLMRLWTHQVIGTGQDWSLSERMDTLIEAYKGGSNSIWGDEAVGRHSLHAILAKVAQLVLVFESGSARSDAPNAATLISGAEVITLESHAEAMMRSTPAPLAKAVLTFLDRA